MPALAFSGSYICTMCSTRLNPSGKNTHDYFNTKSVNAQYVQNIRTKYADYINMIFRGSIAGKKTLLSA